MFDFLNLQCKLLKENFQRIIWANLSTNLSQLGLIYVFAQTAKNQVKPFFFQFHRLKERTGITEKISFYLKQELFGLGFNTNIFWLSKFFIELIY
jgi:hypothetical protein